MLMGKNTILTLYHVHPRPVAIRVWAADGRGILEMDMNQLILQ